MKVIRGSPIRHGTGELDKGGRPVGLPPSRFMGGAFDHAFRQVAILLKERQSDYATALKELRPLTRLRIFQQPAKLN